MEKPKTNQQLRDLIKKGVKPKDIDVSEIVDFSFVFASYNGDLEGIEDWDVSKGRDFRYMFSNSNIFYSDLSKWNVSNGVDFDGMFQHTKFAGRGIQNWDMSKAESIDYMFKNCNCLAYENLKDWNLSNVRTAVGFLQDCYNFNIDVSKWQLHNCKHLANMFSNCYEFEGVGLNEWRITILPNDELIDNKYLDQSLFPLDGTFYNCHKLDVDLSSWRIKLVGVPNRTFYRCSKVVGTGEWDVMIPFRKVYDHDGHIRIECNMLDMFFNVQLDLFDYPGMNPAITYTL